MKLDVKITQGEAAALFELTAGRVSQLVAENVLPMPLTLKSAVKGYCDLLRRTHQRSPEQQRIDQARARMAELKVAEADARVINTNEALDFNDEVHGYIRDLFIGWPASFTRDLRLRTQLADEIDRLLNAVADRLAKADEALKQGSAGIAESRRKGKQNG